MNAGNAFILLLLISACGAAPVVAADQTSAGATRAAPLSAGDRAPDFTLGDQDGRKVSLSAEWKARTVVLVFYRGHW